MSHANILVVEDEEDIRTLIAYQLNREGYEVHEASNGSQALSILHDEVIDLAVLDINLPEMSGLDICRSIRSDERLANIPVMFVTAATQESDVLVGFHSGADDYIRKPFSISELVSRVAALLKRSQNQIEKYVFEGFKIDFPRHYCRVDSNIVSLTPREFNVLQELLKRKQRTLSRQQLLERAWGMETRSGRRSVDIIITRIREKISPYGTCIRTVTGFGYQWDDESFVLTS